MSSGALSVSPASSPADGAARTSALTSTSQVADADLVCSSLPGELVDAWLDHCQACFADKKPYPPSRAYFQTHLQQDPMRDLNGIAILRCAEVVPESKEPVEGEDPPEPFVSQAIDGKVIAATTRIFVRRQFINGKKISFGGIGEVCTKPDYRKRGYAEIVMGRSLAYARKLKLQLASLHTSAEMVPFYVKQGFRSVDLWYGVKSTFEQEKDVNIVGDGLRSGEFSLRVMPVSQFMSPNILPQFTAMYDSYSAQFNGPLVRTEEYWQHWVQSNLESSIGSNMQFPIEIYAAYDEWDGSDPAPNPPSPIRFLSYLFLQRVPNPVDNGSSNRDRIYVVREYAASPQWAGRADGGRQMFLSLVQYAVRQIRHKFAEMDVEAATKAKLAVKFPLPITAKFTNRLQVDSEICDKGLMFQPLTLDLSPEAAAAAAASDAAPVSSVTQFRGSRLEQTPIASPFAASPFVLHDQSEPMTDSSAVAMRDELQTDAKKRVIFWQTDAF